MFMKTKAGDQNRSKPSRRVAETAASGSNRPKDCGARPPSPPPCALRLIEADVLDQQIGQTRHAARVGADRRPFLVAAGGGIVVSVYEIGTD